MKNTPSGLQLDRHFKPQRAPWRMVTLGSTVWAPIGEHSWRPAIVTGLGENRDHHAVVHLHFENGGSGQRHAWQLHWRQPELKGKDKPS